MRSRCWLRVIPTRSCQLRLLLPSLPPSHPVPVASHCHPALSERGPFSLALLGWERSLTHPGQAPADAGGSSFIPSPCTGGRRAALLQTQYLHLASVWQGAPSEAGHPVPPCPTSWTGLCQCI